MRNRILFTAVGIWMGMVLVGCDNSPVEVQDDVAGSYDLEEINGERLPYTFDYGETVTRGTFVIDADGSCEVELIVEFEGGGDIDADSCTWELVGNELQFSGWQYGEPVTAATWSGNEIEKTAWGASWLFRR